MNRVHKGLAVFGACALMTTALCGMTGGLLTNASAEWQEVVGGDFLPALLPAARREERYIWIY